MAGADLHRVHGQGNATRTKCLQASKVVRERIMIDWDDVRYFLAVARSGCVRAAAEQLKVNHTTVLRHIAV